MLGFQQHITFKKDTHQYFDPEKNEYKSVSGVIRSVTPQFDRQGISYVMAKIKAGNEGLTVDKAQELILQDWDNKRDSAIDRGNWIHNNIEVYLTTGNCDEKLVSVGKAMVAFVSSYYKYFLEVIIYDSKFMVAGQADLAVQRQKNAHGVVDFFDYKTNEARGIYFDSVKRKDGKIVKHYNQFLNNPLKHLEHCNFNTYTMQLSLYAYMASITFDIIVGRLGIIFIDNNLKIRMYPVPYMKLETIALLNHFKNSQKSGDLGKSEWEE